jgi:hypothetical protein
MIGYILELRKQVFEITSKESPIAVQTEMNLA